MPLVYKDNRHTELTISDEDRLRFRLREFGSPISPRDVILTAGRPSRTGLKLAIAAVCGWRRTSREDICAYRPNVAKLVQWLLANGYTITNHNTNDAEAVQAKRVRNRWA